MKATTWPPSRLLRRAVGEGSSRFRWINPARTSVDIPHLLLLSGGIDSSAALALALYNRARTIRALFVDYGQAAAQSEAGASSAIASRFRVQLQPVHIKGWSFGAGEIR